MKKRRQGILFLSIGDEILDGRTQNTNASYFGEQCRLNGIPVAEVRAIADDLPEIIRTLQEAQNYKIVVATGGLGPTNDDRTMEGAALAFKKKLSQTKAAFAHVKKCYEARGLPLTPERLRLAQVLPNSKIIQNPTGSAPGVHYKHKNTEYFFLPGPPNECRPMFMQGILPLAKKSLISKKLARREFWRTFGKGESDAFAEISPLVKELEKKYPQSITFGVHISFPCVDFTLEVWKIPGAKTPTNKEIDTITNTIQEKLGRICFTRERETLPEYIVKLLKEKNLTLSTAESCTGGLLGKVITDISGSSSIYKGGVVTYANEAKEILLHVNSIAKHGAVSHQTAAQMAHQIRSRLNADYSLALSGVSGPTGGTPEKPVGTIYVALSNKRETKTMHQVILNSRGSRDQNRVIAMHLALDALRTEILGLQDTRFQLSSSKDLSAE